MQLLEINDFSSILLNFILLGKNALNNIIGSLSNVCVYITPKIVYNAILMFTSFLELQKM